MWCHIEVSHGGRGLTLIRHEGFWIINGNSVTRNLISKCVVCRKFHGRLGQQKMASIPSERTEVVPPFTYCGVDMFGPFNVKQKRSVVKRYCALFTCLNSRAVHIEVCNDLSTDSFILALRRFMGRRGNVRIMRSDNGTNFVGAKNELDKSFKELDHEKVKRFLQSKGSEWII